MEICSKNKIDFKKIKSVVIELSKTPYDIVGQPAEIKFNPKNVVDAQFSAPYSVAIACIEGKASLEEYDETSVQRGDVHEFMKRIKVKHAPDLDKLYPARAARATLTMEDGRHFAQEVRYAKGDPQNPLSWEEILRKFEMIVPSVMVSSHRKRQIIDIIEKFEEIKNIKELTALLC